MINCGLRADEGLDGAANYLAPLAGRGRKLRAAQLPGEGDVSVAICGYCAVAKCPSPHPSPRKRGEVIDRAVNALIGL